MRFAVSCLCGARIACGLTRTLSKQPIRGLGAGPIPTGLAAGRARRSRQALVGKIAMGELRTYLFHRLYVGLHKDLCPCVLDSLLLRRAALPLASHAAMGVRLATRFSFVQIFSCRGRAAEFCEKGSTLCAIDRATRLTYAKGSGYLSRLICHTARFPALFPFLCM